MSVCTLPPACSTNSQAEPASHPEQDRGSSGAPVFDRCFQITTAPVFDRCLHVLEKDESEDYVLILGGVHIAAQLIGGGPHSRFEAKSCAVSFVLLSFCFRHLIDRAYMLLNELDSDWEALSHKSFH